MRQRRATCGRYCFVTRRNCRAGKATVRAAGRSGGRPVARSQHCPGGGPGTLPGGEGDLHPAPGLLCGLSRRVRVSYCHHVCNRCGTARPPQAGAWEARPAHDTLSGPQRRAGPGSLHRRTAAPACAQGPSRGVHEVRTCLASLPSSCWDSPAPTAHLNGHAACPADVPLTSAGCLGLVAEGRLSQ